MLCSQLAYWTIRLMTAVPSPTPATLAAEPDADPDPVLLARAFGQVEQVAPEAFSNIRVAGVFAAGPDSAAVFVVGDQPAAAVLLGQEVAPGSRLVEVDPQSVTLESGGVRRELRVPTASGSDTGALAVARDARYEQRSSAFKAPRRDAARAPTPKVARSPSSIFAPRPEPTPAQ
ncbi:MAG TPA: hypothetical protein VH278_05510 [Burkholderiaceae bacterium]|nr:hypothetical protein [Burkholderiaceae bacterium]